MKRVLVYCKQDKKMFVNGVRRKAISEAGEDVGNQKTYKKCVECKIENKIKEKKQGINVT